MNLQDYFSRIHYSGPAAVDVATLREIHHRHLLHIPYENLDVQLGHPVDLNIERIYDKIVERQRGGWCYEMNGLLGWALETIGFKVTRMAGAVMRAVQGDVQIGNHLVLEVMLDEPYLADVGLGDGLREPIPLREGSYQQEFLPYRLELLQDGYWRLHNQPGSNVSSFDFKQEPASEQLLAEKCQWLQTAEESPFKKLFVAYRFSPQNILVQLGKTFIKFDDGRTIKADIHDLSAFNSHMAKTFGLNEDFGELWPSIVAAHERFVKSDKQPGSD